jgi:diguanylate cyclase (GGDEF)-like protein
VSAALPQAIALEATAVEAAASTEIDTAAAFTTLALVPTPVAAAEPVWPASALLEALPNPAWLVEAPSGRVVALNAAAAAFFGADRASLCALGGERLASSPEDMAWWADAAAGELRPLSSDTIVALPDGRVLPVSRSICPLAPAGATGGSPLDASLGAALAGPAIAGSAMSGGAKAAEPGAPILCLVTLVDRSTEQRIDDEREALLAEMRATLDSTADGILVTDLAGRIRAVNRRFGELWSLPDTLLQQHDDDALLGWMGRAVGDAEAHALRWLALQLDGMGCSEDRLQLRNGRVIEQVSRPLMHGGRAQGRVFAFRDITDRLQAERRIEVLETTDSLTGLPNRGALAAAAAVVLTQARRDGRALALLLVDLDRFRRINDILGHDTGDEALRGVARRIQGVLRQHDLLARLGGDQFAIVIQPVDEAAAEAAARRVLNAVAQPCSLDGEPFTLTCSIGVALCPSHGNNLDDLLRHAEAAMRRAKSAGRAGFRLHQARAGIDRRMQLKLDHAMRQALVSGRFRLHYQPRVALADGRVLGAEALLRWRDPELGEVSPGRFIPVAEDSGFIVAIGDWVLTQAVRQAALWHERGRTLPLAVNVSGLQFQQPEFVERVASVLAVSQLPPHLLELELTESILVLDAEDALQRLHALAALGVRLAIDDFGTHYSSLTYLKRLPVGMLKIDRSFVQGLPADAIDAGIVRAIVQMGQALGMEVVAEGVETEGQRDFLQRAGCHSFQGFLYAPALDVLNFEERALPAALVPQGEVDSGFEAAQRRPVPRHIRLVQR